MKNLLFLPVFLISSLVWAQQPYSFEAAQKQAAAESKKILLVFSGSDWCGPCIKMDKNLWSQPDFQAYAAKALVFFKADFPRRKKNQLSSEQQKVNNQLAEIYNPEGYFPRVLLLDAQGSIIKQFTYDDRSPTAFIQALE